jgi:epoxyqueuosine reductase QueG
LGHDSGTARPKPADAFQAAAEGFVAMNEAELRTKIEFEARALGADLIGFAPVERWRASNELRPEYWPQTIWSKAQTVIVLGVPMLLPIIESTPSINHTVLYDTTNTLLDQMAYRLAVFLNNLGHASIFMPRDGYGSLEILLKKMPACFSHVYAGKYAGLGTIGYSHNLLNPKYGPRARYVSVLTSAVVPGDEVIEKNLCKGCRLCDRLCPAQAMSPVEGSAIAQLDAVKCTHFHQELVAEDRWPCGVCSKVCAVGEDRKLYGSTNLRVYIEEREAIAKDPAHPDYKHLVHLREHGSSGDRKY